MRLYYNLLIDYNTISYIPGDYKIIFDVDIAAIWFYYYLIIDVRRLNPEIAIRPYLIAYPSLDKND